MRNIFLLFCVSILFVSCHDEINYKGTYTASKYESGNIQLFTKAGEITNSSTINNFKANHQSSLSVTYGGLYETVLLTPAEVHFLSSTEAQFLFVYNTSVKVVKESNILYLEEKDTIDLGLRYYDFPLKKPSIFDVMLKYKELYRDTFALNDANNSYGIRIRKCNYFIESGSVLNMPFMTYWYFQPYSTQSGSVNNSFDSSCLEFMEDKDTLAIQQNQVVFK